MQIMRGLLLLIALMGAWITWAPVSSAPEAGLNAMKAGVVKIRAGIDEGEEQKTWQTGTGFIVFAKGGRHYVLTVTHVVKGADEIHLDYYDPARTTLPARVVKMEGADPNGLALLEVARDKPSGTKVLFSGKSGDAGDAVVAIGFPRGGAAWHASKGNINGTQGRAHVFSAPVDSGNSGGPLFDSGGRFVGIVTSTRAKIGYATRSVIIDETLKGWGFALPEPPKPGLAFPKKQAVLFSGFDLAEVRKDGRGLILYGSRREDMIMHRIQYRLDERLRGTPTTLYRQTNKKQSLLWAGVVGPGLYGTVEYEASPEVGSETTRLADFDKAGKKLPIKTPDFAEYEIRKYVRLPDGDLMTFGYRYGNWHALRWNPVSGALKYNTELKDRFIFDFASLPDGSVLACGMHTIKFELEDDRKASMVIRLEPDGKVIRQYLAPVDDYGLCRRVVPLRKGGALMLGVSRKPDDYARGQLVRLNDGLNIVWKATIGSGFNVSEIPFDHALELKNGDILIALPTRSEQGRFRHVRRLNSAGKRLWELKFRFSVDDLGMFVEAENGDLLIGGRFNRGDSFILRVGSSGEILPARPSQ